MNKRIHFKLWNSRLKCDDDTFYWVKHEFDQWVLEYNKSMSTSDQLILTNNMIFVMSQNAAQNVTQNAEKNIMKNDISDFNARSLSVLINLFDVFDMSNKSNESNSW